MSFDSASDNPFDDDRIPTVKAIAKFRHEDERHTGYLLRKGRIPGAYKEGATWIASKTAMIDDYNKRTGRKPAPPAPAQGTAAPSPPR